MNDESNKIMSALLELHGISGFLPFEKPVDCKIEDPLYAYIKDDVFFICDSSLKTYSRKEINLRSSGSLLIVATETQYNVSETTTDSCFVISAENKILVHNPQYYCYINQECFYTGEPFFIDEESVGVVYNIDKYIYNKKDGRPIGVLIPFFTFPVKNIDYNRYYDLREAPFFKGIKDYNIDYLCTIGDVFYFYNIKTGELLLSNNDGNNIFLPEHKNGDDNNSHYFVIWYSNCGSMAIDIEMNYLDVEQHLFDSITIRCYGERVGTKNTISLESHNEVLYLHVSKIEATGDFLFIQFESWFSSFLIVMDHYGNTCYTGPIEECPRETEVTFKNNLIKVQFNEYDDGYVIDCYGNILLNRDRIKDDIDAFDRGDASKIRITSPCQGIFNSSDLADFKKHTNIKGTNLYGVIDFKTGKMLVPAVFSGVDTSLQGNPNVSDGGYKQLSIVWIDHFFNGKRTYYGAFLDDELIMPICSDKIEFLTYEREVKGSKELVKSGFIVVERNGLYGVYNCWGQELLPCEAKEVTLMDNHEYALALENDNEITIVYRNKVVCRRFCNVEQIEDKKDMYLYAYSLNDSKCCVIYKGELKLCYDDIGEPNSTLKAPIFIVELNGLKGVVDLDNNIIIPIQHQDIFVSQRYMKIDGVIYKRNNELVIDTNEYYLVNSYEAKEGRIEVYMNDDEYVILGLSDFYPLAVDHYPLNDLPRTSYEILNCTYYFKDNFKDDYFEEYEIKEYEVDDDVDFYDPRWKEGYKSAFEGDPEAEWNID